MRTPCAVVGAGPAGIAMSTGLLRRGVDHVVLEREDAGNTWSNQRWDSFRLNTPTWMNATLGEVEPGSFCTRDEVIELLRARARALPVQTDTAVTGMTRTGSGFVLRTSRGEIRASTVVLATGYLNVPVTPAAAVRLSPRVRGLHASEYRSPERLPAGAVLVVGGAQSGCQIAEDLTRAGRRVYLATSRVGRYNWTYRGREMFHWMTDIGFWDQRPADLDDPSMMRAAQPIVASGGRSLSLAMMAAMGVTLLGRLRSVDGERVTLEDSVATHVTAGDLFWARLTGLVDGYIVRSGVDAESAGSDEGAGTVTSDGREVLDLAAADVGSVVWCTGFTDDLSWVQLPILDDHGRPRHDDCASPVPGLWYVGMPWLTRRRSGILYGFPVDAAEVADAATEYLSRQPALG